jgi:hypothetical protein
MCSNKPRRHKKSRPSVGFSNNQLIILLELRQLLELQEQRQLA